MTLFAGGDHDAGSSRDNAVPTVTLISDIPEESSDSFYQGQVYVAVKSSIMQPSTVVRAHTELSKLLIREKKDEQYIGILLTGGGPEHNLNFTSVQIALIIMWRMVTFDILVVCRSCPQNSWTNEVERVMSVLNLGLYSMCFSRLKMVPVMARDGKGRGGSLEEVVSYGGKLEARVNFYVEAVSGYDDTTDCSVR